MKLATIVGARPQFIKAGPVSEALDGLNRAASSTPSTEVLVHTGQHYDYQMSQVFFDELGLKPPDYHLGVGSGPHGAQTGEMLRRTEEVLLKEEPDIVLVYGDTNTTMAGALAAAKLHIPVAHVEAGLRSFNRAMPEEVNRIVTDHVSTLLFAPTQTAVNNLRREGITKGVHLVGDVMYDAALKHRQLAKAKSRILEILHVEPRKYALATVHRAENTDNLERLRGIFDALQAISQDLPVVVPLHPRTRRAIGPSLALANDRLILTEPVSYLDMLLLESETRLILTDSGGVQKEAYFFRVPCVTLRDETEWVETVDTGWNVLAGAKPEAIVEAAWQPRYGRDDASLFGEGTASRTVVELVAGFPGTGGPNDSGTCV